MSKPTILRGKILEFLRDLYPNGADERTIVGIFYPYHKYEEIVEAANYLAAKEYATLKEVAHPYRRLEKIRLFTIDHAGIDLLDGTIMDPAVTVIPEGG
jgi:hypothetical protein